MQPCKPCGRGRLFPPTAATIPARGTRASGRDVAPSGQVSRRGELQSALGVTTLPAQGTWNDDSFGRSNMLFHGPVQFNDAYVQRLLGLSAADRQTQFRADWCVLPQYLFPDNAQRVVWTTNHPWCGQPDDLTIYDLARNELRKNLRTDNLPADNTRNDAGNVIFGDAYVRQLLSLPIDRQVAQFWADWCVQPAGGFATDEDAAAWRGSHPWCSSAPAAVTTPVTDPPVEPIPPLTVVQPPPAFHVVTDTSDMLTIGGGTSTRRAAAPGGSKDTISGPVIRGMGWGPPPPPAPLPPLAAPMLNSPSSALAVIADADVAFTWATVPGAQSYEFRLCSDAGLSVGCIAGTGGGLRLSGLTVTMRLPAGSYFWSVRAISSTGTPGILAEARPLRSVAAAPSALPAPTLLLPADGTTYPSEHVPFTWTALPGIGAYEVIIARNAELTQDPLIHLVGNAALGGNFNFQGGPGDIMYVQPTANFDMFWSVRAVAVDNTRGPFAPARRLRTVPMSTQQLQNTPPTQTLGSGPGALLASLGLTCDEWSQLSAADQGGRLSLLLPTRSPVQLDHGTRGVPSEAATYNPIPGQIAAINTHCEQERAGLRHEVLPETMAPPAAVKRSLVKPVLIAAGAVGVVGLGWWLLRTPTPSPQPNWQRGRGHGPSDFSLPDLPGDDDDEKKKQQAAARR